MKDEGWEEGAHYNCMKEVNDMPETGANKGDERDEEVKGI